MPEGVPPTAADVAATLRHHGILAAGRGAKTAKKGGGGRSKRGGGGRSGGGNAGGGAARYVHHDLDGVLVACVVSWLGNRMGVTSGARCYGPAWK